MKLLVVATPEQFELNLEYSCSHSGTNSHKPVYTRSIETRRYKSKIKIGIRLKVARMYPAENKIVRRADGVSYLKLFFEL